MKVLGVENGDSMIKCCLAVCLLAISGFLITPKPATDRLTRFERLSELTP